MRNLIDFIQQHLYWLVFLLLEFISLVALFKYNAYQGSVFFSTANSVVGTINEWTSGVDEYFHLKETNARLEAANAELRKQLLETEQRLDCTVQDSTVVAGDSSLVDFQFVQAKVVNATVNRANNLLTIDKGSADGIQPEMGVVCSQGVVGVVYLTSPHFSTVIPLLNTSSKTSCRLDSTNYFGTMEWRHGSPRLSYVNGIPRHAKVAVGDVVETNGFSDIFPENIPIGKVVKIEDSSNGMAYSLTVKLFTEFSTLRHVSVITNYTQPERLQLEQQTDSLINKL